MGIDAAEKIHLEILYSFLVNRIKDDTKIINIGAGNLILSNIIRKGFGCEVFDTDKYPINKKVVELDITRISDIKRLDIINKLDICLFINVLEHIEDHKLALENINKILKDDGLLLLSIPYNSRLYDYEDIIVGHYRRYDENTIESMIVDAGFVIEEGFIDNNYLQRVFHDIYSKMKRRHLEHRGESVVFNMSGRQSIIEGELSKLQRLIYMVFKISPRKRKCGRQAYYICRKVSCK